MYTLSLCAGTILTELPFEARLRKIAAAGFTAELWDWDEDAIDRIGTDPTVAVTSMPGWIGGSMVHPDGVDAYLEGVEERLQTAARCGCSNLCITTGPFAPDLSAGHAIAEHPANFWISAYKTLSRIAELAEKHNVLFHLETLNTKVDHAGYPLPLPEDGAQLVREVGSPRIRLLCDIYHVQVQQGNIIPTLRNCWDVIGNIHVADVPGRHEPGTGEIGWPAIVDFLRTMDYQGAVCMEAFPATDSMRAIAAFRDLFDPGRS